jgi:hypothetical protein
MQTFLTVKPDCMQQGFGIDLLSLAGKEQDTDQIGWK